MIPFNLQSFCLKLLSTGITGIFHHALLGFPFYRPFHSWAIWHTVTQVHKNYPRQCKKYMPGAGFELRYLDWEEALHPTKVYCLLQQNPHCSHFDSQSLKVQSCSHGTLLRGMTLERAAAVDHLSQRADVGAYLPKHQNVLDVPLLPSTIHLP